MKFVAVALAALAGFSEAKKVVNNAELNRRLKNGLVNKRTLMAGAKPANEATRRKLNDNEFEITGDYSIQFNSCISLTVQNENIWEDANLIDMAGNGDLISEKDYIMFNVCETEYCSYYEDDDKMTFIAEVGVYFQAISQYLPNKVEEYCEACEENYDYCYAMANGYQYYPEGYEEDNQQDEENQDEGGEDEGDEDGGRRKARKLANGQLIKFIDCQMCADYECLDFQMTNSNGFYDENGDYVDAELDDAMEWLNDFSECSETYSYLDEYLLYSALMCNADGDGLEIGLFMDDECMMYTPKVAYKDVMQSSDEVYYGMISEIVEFTFTNEGIECYDPEVVWYNEVDYYYEQQNGEGQDEEEEEDDGEAPEAGEWCQELVGDDAVDLYDCAGYYPENNGDEEGDDYVNNYEWYQYELQNEDAEDIQAVCYTVQQLEGELHTVFNGEHEGLFNYHRNKTSSSSSGMGAGKVVGIILLVLVAVGGAFGAMTYFKNKDGADKKKPLINEEGQLA